MVTCAAYVRPAGNDRRRGDDKNPSHNRTRCLWPNPTCGDERARKINLSVCSAKRRYSPVRHPCISRLLLRRAGLSRLIYRATSIGLCQHSPRSCCLLAAIGLWRACFCSQSPEETERNPTSDLNSTRFITSTPGLAQLSAKRPCGWLCESLVAERGLPDHRRAGSYPPEEIVRAD